MPNQTSIKMEDMSEAYLRALCAANGFSLERESRDNDGVDVNIKCVGKLDSASIIKSPVLAVQLKSSSAKIREISGGESITYPLAVKNYETLIDPNRMIPIILVVFQMYQDENKWIEQDIDWLKITKCAFWISLRGRNKTTNASTINIDIPKSNLLTKDSLKDIMLRISKGEKL